MAGFLFLCPRSPFQISTNIIVYLEFGFRKLFKSAWEIPPVILIISVDYYEVDIKNSKIDYTAKTHFCRIEIINIRVNLRLRL